MVEAGWRMSSVAGVTAEGTPGAGAAVVTAGASSDPTARGRCPYREPSNRCSGGKVEHLMRLLNRLQRAGRGKEAGNTPVVPDVWADKRVPLESLPQELRPEPGRFARGSVWDDIHLPATPDQQETWARVAAALPADERGEHRFIAVLKAEPCPPEQICPVSVWAGREPVGNLTPQDAEWVRADLLAVEASGTPLWCVGILTPAPDDGQWALRLGFTRPLPTERDQGIMP